MSVGYTTNLALAQPVVGTEDGTWGDDVNNGLTSYLDIAVAGSLSVTVTVADVTLTNTQGTSSATNIGSTTAQYAILNVNGAKTAARSIIVPNPGKTYIVNNAGTSSGGTFALTIKCASTSGITLIDGERAIIAWNGSDYAKITSSVVSNYTGTLGIANGGTGATTAPYAMANLAGFTSTATAGATTTLTNASSYFQLFTGTLNQTVQLPVTSTLTTGWMYRICNNSTGTLTVNSSGGNLVISVPSTATATVTCIGTTLTTAADWDFGISTFDGVLPIANGGTGATTLNGAGIATLTDTQTLTNKTLTNPTITNYVETVLANGTVVSASTLSLTNGTVQTATLTAGTACTFTMPTATAGKSFVLLLKQAATTGNGTATFTGVKWNASGAPTITATAGKMDILSFIADGTNWYGSYTQGYTP